MSINVLDKVCPAISCLDTLLLRGSAPLGRDLLRWPMKKARRGAPFPHSYHTHPSEPVGN